MRSNRNIPVEMPHPGLLESLDDLLAYAESYATFTMRGSGHLGATLMALSANGTLMFLPGSTPDAQAKDEFVRIARLVCIAHCATAVVLVAEAWMSRQPGPSERRSAASDPQEIIMVQGEAPESRKQKMLPIIRDKSGMFCRFGTSGDFQSEGVRGRFSRFLPPRPPSPEIQSAAKGVLATLGVTLQQVEL